MIFSKKLTALLLAVSCVCSGEVFAKGGRNYPSVEELGNFVKARVRYNYRQKVKEDVCALESHQNDLREQLKSLKKAEIKQKTEEGNILLRKPHGQFTINEDGKIVRTKKNTELSEQYSMQVIRKLPVNSKGKLLVNPAKFNRKGVSLDHDTFIKELIFFNKLLTVEQDEKMWADAMARMLRYGDKNRLKKIVKAARKGRVLVED